MSQIPKVPSASSLAYILLNQEFEIQRYSELSRQYCEQFTKLTIGEDIRQSFPELIGLESICSQIITQQKDKFVLESVTREQSPEELIYFDLEIQAVENHLLLLLDDVTELASIKQSFIQKANETELTVNALKRFEYCTNRIINSMGELLFITDHLGRIERVNQTTTNILGCRRSELLGHSISSLLPNLELDFNELYQLLVNQKYSVKKIETVLASKQANQIEIEFNCFAVPTDIPELYNCVLIGRDITLRKQAERDMLQALNKEKQLRELKSQFISMASHEFRNPLSSILICADVLTSQSNSIALDERDFYLQLIKDSAINLQYLVEDVLLLSKAEAGKQTLKLLTFDLGEFCQQIIRELELSYPKRQINFASDRQNLECYGDPKLLWHIFTNLIGNALKYSPTPEAVDLRICTTTTHYLIEIADRGIGIPQDAQKNLFESFYRASNTGEISGTGLGLAIVKRSLDLHQGTIEIISEQDCGTLVKLKLPRNLQIE